MFLLVSGGHICERFSEYLAYKLLHRPDSWQGSVCTFIFFHFPDSRLSVLKGFHFYFCFPTWVKTENYAKYGSDNNGVVSSMMPFLVADFFFKQTCMRHWRHRHVINVPYSLTPPPKIKMTSVTYFIFKEMLIPWVWTRSSYQLITVDELFGRLHPLRKQKVL